MFLRLFVKIPTKTILNSVIYFLSLIPHNLIFLHSFLIFFSSQGLSLFPSLSFLSLFYLTFLVNFAFNSYMPSSPFWFYDTISFLLFYCYMQCMWHFTKQRWFPYLTRCFPFCFFFWFQLATCLFISLFSFILSSFSFVFPFKSPP